MRGGKKGQRVRPASGESPVDGKKLRGARVAGSRNRRRLAGGRIARENLSPYSLQRKGKRVKPDELLRRDVDFPKQAMTSKAKYPHLSKTSELNPQKKKQSDLYPSEGSSATLSPILW